MSKGFEASFIVIDEPSPEIVAHREELAADQAAARAKRLKEAEERGPFVDERRARVGESINEVTDRLCAFDTARLRAQAAVLAANEEFRSCPGDASEAKKRVILAQNELDRFSGVQRRMIENVLASHRATLADCERWEASARASAALRAQGRIL